MSTRRVLAGIGALALVAGGTAAMAGTNGPLLLTRMNS